MLGFFSTFAARSRPRQASAGIVMRASVDDHVAIAAAVSVVR
jgi:hypothetical protein